MKNIYVSDTSLSGLFCNNVSTLTFKEKLEIAKSIDELGVDIIEFTAFDKSDEVLIKTLSSCIKQSALAIYCGRTEEDIEKSYGLISFANRKRLILNIPVSTVAMEYSLGKKPKAVIELVSVLVKKAVSLCEDVEIVFDDALRAEKTFLAQVVKNAIDGGVKTVTFNDIEGVMLPVDFSEFISSVYQSVPELKDVRVALAINNEYSLSLVDYVCALNCGVSQLKISSLKGCLPNALDLYKIMDTVGCKKGFGVRLNKLAISQIEKKISDLSNSENNLWEKTENSSKILKNDISIKELSAQIKALGHDLTVSDTERVYAEFNRLSQKKEVSTKELDVIIANYAMQVPETYSLKTFSVNSTNVMNATASIVLIKDKQELTGVSLGNGAVDAAFLAIENVTGRHFDLENFELGAVTEGKEAMGQTVVKLRANGKLYSGRGVSTDIVGASIRAYINALNKIVYEENK